MKLVPNAGSVLTKASSVWALYGGLAILMVNVIHDWLKDPGTASLMSPATLQLLLGVCTALGIIFRVIQQEALRTATERQLEQEKLVRLQLEQVATSEGPPITPQQVKAIKRDAAAEVSQPSKGVLRE